MDITPTNLNIFFTALNTVYQTAYQDTPTWQEQIATPFSCNTESWLTSWVGRVAKLRLWKGARDTTTLAPLTYGATMQPFQEMIPIDQFKLEDDQYGIYTPLAKELGEASKKWPDYTIRDLIEGLGDYSGTTVQTGPDGVSFWNAAHPVNYYDASLGTYCNDYGASGTSINGITVGGAFAVNSFATVWSDMASRKYENGERMGLQPNLTMLPIQMQFAGKTILQNGMFSPQTLQGLGTGNFPTAGSPVAANAPFVGAMDNPLRGSTDLMVNFDLTSVAAWYMLCTRRAVKPFGFILRTAPYTTPRTSPTDPVVFDTHTFVFGVTARGTPIWSLPWLAVRSGV